MYFNLYQINVYMRVHCITNIYYCRIVILSSCFSLHCLPLLLLFTAALQSRLNLHFFSVLPCSLSSSETSVLVFGKL